MEKRLCLVVSFLGIKVVGDIIVARRRVGMVLSKLPLAYLKGLSVKRLCFAVSSLGMKVVGDIIVALCRVWMVLVRAPSCVSQEPFGKAALLGRIVPGALRLEGDIIIARRRDGMVLSELPLAYLKGLLEKWLCLAVSSLGLEVKGDIIVARRRVWMILNLNSPQENPMRHARSVHPCEPGLQSETVPLSAQASLQNLPASSCLRKATASNKGRRWLSVDLLQRWRHCARFIMFQQLSRSFTETIPIKA